MRKFGITMGIASICIAMVIFIRHKHGVTPFIIVSSVFLAAAFIAPVRLKPVYIIWMKLALVLSWINTRLILLIIYYFIFTPVGLMMKLFGKDLLDTKIERFRDSYWNKKEKQEFNPSDYERQF